MNAFVELGMFEVATFLSQFNGINTLATVVALFQYIICFYTIPTGQSTASAILIGSLCNTSFIHIEACFGGKNKKKLSQIFWYF